MQRGVCARQYPALRREIFPHFWYKSVRVYYSMSSIYK